MARAKTKETPKVATPTLNSRRSPSMPASPDKPTGPLSMPVPPDDREVVKVNIANVTELKIACDDAVRRYLSRPDLFKTIYLHTDVRLALGWASVFVAAGTSFYGYKVEFERSKPVVWAGLILYMLLTLVQTAYAYFIEGDIVFVGKRKTFSKRIVSERISLLARTEPATKTQPPAYDLTVNYVRSTNGGKSLLAKSRTHATREYNAFFDENGTMEQERFEHWVGELVEQAMEGIST